jgi:hypothetical protein
MRESVEREGGGERIETERRGEAGVRGGGRERALELINEVVYPRKYMRARAFSPYTSTQTLPLKHTP